MIPGRGSLILTRKGWACREKWVDEIQGSAVLTGRSPRTTGESWLIERGRDSRLVIITSHTDREVKISLYPTWLNLGPRVMSEKYDTLLLWQHSILLMTTPVFYNHNINYFSSHLQYERLIWNIYIIIIDRL